eukprot:1613724-Rhodomonas_salina.1
MYMASANNVHGICLQCTRRVCGANNAHGSQHLGPRVSNCTPPRSFQRSHRGARPPESNAILAVSVQFVPGMQLISRYRAGTTLPQITDTFENAVPLYPPKLQTLRTTKEDLVLFCPPIKDNAGTTLLTEIRAKSRVFCTTNNVICALAELLRRSVILTCAVVLRVTLYAATACRGTDSWYVVVQTLGMSSS